jgi:hypothetical protein
VTKSLFTVVAAQVVKMSRFLQEYGTLKQRENSPIPYSAKRPVVNKPPAVSLSAKQLSNNYLISTVAPASSS